MRTQLVNNLLTDLLEVVSFYICTVSSHIFSPNSYTPLSKIRNLKQVKIQDEYLFVNFWSVFKIFLYALILIIDNWWKMFTFSFSWKFHSLVEHNYTAWKCLMLRVGISHALCQTITSWLYTTKWMPTIPLFKRL